MKQQEGLVRLQEEERERAGGEGAKEEVNEVRGWGELEIHGGRREDGDIWIWQGT